MANVTDDIKKISAAVVTLALFGAQKLSKAAQAIPIATTFENLKAGFDSITPGAMYSTDQIAVAIFKILSAVADISKSLYVQDLESLAKDLYTIFTGGQGADFATVWTEIQNLFNGKLKGQAAKEPDTTADAAALESGLVTLVGYIISKLPASTPVVDINALLSGIKEGMDAAFPDVAITNDVAMEAIYEVLDAVADLTGSQTPLSIETILRKIYALVNSDVNSFFKFFQGIGVAIEARRLAKQAAKEAKA